MQRRILFLLLAASAAAAEAGEAVVAVAANVGGPMRDIAAQFTRTTGHRLVTTLGSTGKLAAQIRQGAPFDALLAADVATPRALVAEGFAMADSQFTYATGRLALWSAQPGLVDGAGQVLRQEPRGRLALANPRAAPYGAAAIATLRELGVLERWEAHFVLGESVAQAYQFVVTGNAPFGFVALSQVMRDGRLVAGSAWVVPAHLHAPLRQDFVLLARGARNPAALAFAQYLRGPAALRILRRHAYE